MSDVNGGLVSNPSDREMQGSRRGSSAHAAATDPNAWELSWVEPHADKRDIGQLSNRKLIEPSASGCLIPAYVDKITGRDWMGWKFCFGVVVQNRWMNRHVGIVPGGPLQIGFTSCRDGNRMCSPLGHRHLKSESLFHTTLLLIVSGVDDCSSVEDKGLWRMSMGMKVRKTFVFDHNECFASSFIEGTMTCRRAAYLVYNVTSSHWSQFFLCTCTQGEGAGSMGDVPGRGISSDGGNPQTQHIGDPVSDSCNVNCKPTSDHVNNLPMLILESCQSSHLVVRQAFPVWTSMETSHPFIQLSSCLTAFTQGGRAAERVSNVLRSVPVGTPASYLEQSGMCSYLFAAYELIPTTILSSRVYFP